MSLLDETVEVPRRTMTIFFMVDTSGRMSGSKIGAINESIQELLPMIRIFQHSILMLRLKLPPSSSPEGQNGLAMSPSLQMILYGMIFLRKVRRVILARHAGSSAASSRSEGL